MKKALIFFSIFGLFFPHVVFADVNVQVSNNSSSSNSNVSVNSETQGETTTCINGKCTTTGGGSKSTACVNGKCYESENGNLDVADNNGNTQVHIGNSVSGSSFNNSEGTPITKSATTITTEKKKEVIQDAIKKAETKKINLSIFQEIVNFFKQLFPLFK